MSRLTGLAMTVQVADPRRHLFVGVNDRQGEADPSAAERRTNEHKPVCAFDVSRCELIHGSNSKYHSACDAEDTHQENEPRHSICPRSEHSRRDCCLQHESRLSDGEHVNPFEVHGGPLTHAENGPHSYVVIPCILYKSNQVFCTSRHYKISCFVYCIHGKEEETKEEETSRSGISH